MKQNNLNVHYSKMFFGDNGAGIARHDIARYPTLQKLDERMKSFFWQPMEIDMSQEKASFNRMTDAEKFVFTSNLRRQILLDSIQGRAPSVAFLPYSTDPQLEACIQSWSFFEQIHSISYGYIIRAIYPDPSVVFDELPNVPEIVDCSRSIASAYDALIESPSKENLYLALIAANALEALRFYVSFACTFSFGERGLVEGSAKTVKFIARDENCLHPNTEILTEKGWVNVFDVADSHKVAQVNIETGEISFSKPIKVIRKSYNGDMISIQKTHGGKILQNITSDHDVAVMTFNNNKKQFSNIKKIPASDVKMHGFNYIPVSGTNMSKSTSLTYEEKLAIAIQADGSFRKRYTGEIVGTIPVSIFLKKQRKIERLDKILSNLNYFFSKKQKNDGYEYRIDLPKDTMIDKDFDWVDLTTVNTNWAREFMTELVEWDGYKPKDADYLYYSNTNKNAFGKVQAILTFTGYSHRAGFQEDNRKETYSDVYRLYWWEEHNDIGMVPTQNLEKHAYSYDGEVGCVTMPEGTIITRYDGNVCVTGNCHLALVQYILKQLPQDDPDFIQIIGDLNGKANDIFDEAAEQERDWVKFLFQEGPILGVNEHILNSYVDYLLPRRKFAAGISKTRSTSAHPIPWVEKWFSNGSTQLSPQEVEISAYVTGTVKNDLSDMQFEF